MIDVFFLKIKKKEEDELGILVVFLHFLRNQLNTWNLPWYIEAHIVSYSVVCFDGRIREGTRWIIRGCDKEGI